MLISYVLSTDILIKLIYLKPRIEQAPTLGHRIFRLTSRAPLGTGQELACISIAMAAIMATTPCHPGKNVLPAWEP